MLTPNPKRFAIIDWVFGSSSVLLWCAGMAIPSAILFYLGITSFEWAQLWTPLHRQALLNSVYLTFGTAVIASCMGIPLGIACGSLQGRYASLVRILCSLPYVLPGYISAIAWITLANPNAGWLTHPLSASLREWLTIYSLPGAMWVMGLETTPLIMLVIADSWRNFDRSLIEQARICGASPSTIFRKIIVPLLFPRWMSGLSLVCATTLAAFGVPYLLASGSAHPQRVLTTRMTQLIELDPRGGQATAIGLSLVLIIVSLGLTAFFSRLGRTSFSMVTGKAHRQMNHFSPITLAIICFWLAIAVVLPLGTLVLQSILAQPMDPVTIENLTLKRYQQLLGRSDVIRTLLHSLSLAATTSIAVTVVGGWLAWRTRGVHHNSWVKPALASLKLPYAIPGTVLALGLLLVWSQELRLIVFERLTISIAASGSLSLLGLAYIVRYLSVGITQTQNALTNIDRSLEEAARVCGATPTTAARKILLPLLAPSLAGTAFLVFLPSFTEVTMSVLLAGPESRVIGTLLFELQSYGDPAQAAVLGVMIVAFVVSGVGILRVATRGRFEI